MRKDALAFPIVVYELVLILVLAEEVLWIFSFALQEIVWLIVHVFSEGAA